MRWILAIVFIAVGLAGCANRHNYKIMVESWKGRTEPYLVRNWGAPTSTYERGGVRILTYTYDSGVLVSGATVGGSAFLSPERNVCKTEFFFEKGVVNHWLISGNDCKARNRNSDLRNPRFKHVDADRLTY